MTQARSASRFDPGAVRVVVGKRVEPMPAGELRALVQRHQALHLDLGTGDGKFVLREAARDPSTFVIGVDAVAEAMAESARRGRRAPKRGGCSNALFVHAAAERLPEAIVGLVDRLTVLYPWGSLLQGVWAPEPALFGALAELLKPGGAVRVVYNRTVLDDDAYAQRLGLAPLGTGDHVDAELVPGWTDAGFVSVAVNTETRGDMPTSWGRRLVRGSGRQELVLSAIRGR